ncbi:MAG: inositol monophosphatase family protein [bacterium]
MTTSDDLDDLSLALALADTADGVTLPAFRREGLVVETKPDLTPVTEADRGAEATLRAELGRRRPGDTVVGEEMGGTLGSGRQWILDPIDGTKNFVRGVPVWASLIALVIDGLVEVGVVSAPALGRRWWAARGLGAWTRGPEDSTDRRLRASAVGNLADASFSFSDGIGWPPGALDALAASAWRSRAYGDFWSHMLVAEGSVDIAMEPELSVWDVAALVPIVEEAGGRITAIDGGDVLQGPGALTTNGLMHGIALDAVNAQR